MHKGSILLIEDEVPLANALIDFLEDNNYACHWEPQGDTGLHKAAEGPFDIIVLDRMLPGMSGLEICSTLRKNNNLTPILFLSAKGSEQDRIDGFDAGADDYLPKPFSSAELLARISAILRRSSSSSSFFTFGNNTLDVATHELCHKNKTTALTAKEFELLMYFLKHNERVISRAELLEKIWGYSSSQVTRTIDIHIAALRQKIEDNPKKPKLLCTLHAQGYRFSKNKK